MEMAEGNDDDLLSDNSAVTGDDSRQFFGPRLLGLHAEPGRSEWTDEKHGMYLSFIEASFVNQLYNHEPISLDSLGWEPVRQQELLNNNSAQSTQSNRLSSGQFKVLQSGDWQMLSFSKGQTHLDCDGKSRKLLENPWIRHFRHLSSGQQLETSDLQLGDSLIGDKQFQMSVRSGFTKLQSSVCCGNSITQNAEVSDQNFVEGSYGCVEDELKNSCGRKRVVSILNSASNDDFTSQSAYFLLDQLAHMKDPQDRHFFKAGIFYEAPAKSEICVWKKRHVSVTLHF